MRQRFTLAYFRLGHGTVYYRDTDVSSARDPQEVAVNAFAAELLAPRAAVCAWMERRGDPTSTSSSWSGSPATSASAQRPLASGLRPSGCSVPASASSMKRSLLASTVQLLFRLSLAEMQDSLTAITTLPRLPRAIQQHAITIYEAGRDRRADVAAARGG